MHLDARKQIIKMLLYQFWFGKCERAIITVSVMSLLKEKSSFVLVVLRSEYSIICG